MTPKCNVHVMSVGGRTAWLVVGIVLLMGETSCLVVGIGVAKYSSGDVGVATS